MSASLVGSEMCIRDRSLPADLWSGVSLTLVATEMMRTSMPAVSPNRWCCLVCTSDAADDM
eukprot:15196328-Alexandrium_andersonii.AAC.1